MVAKYFEIKSMYENTKFYKITFIHIMIMLSVVQEDGLIQVVISLIQHDAKIYAREQIRLRLSLDEAKKQGFDKFIVMIHYPPFGEENKETEFTKIFKEYKWRRLYMVTLHGPSNFKAIRGSTVNGVEYIIHHVIL